MLFLKNAEKPNKKKIASSHDHEAIRPHERKNVMGE
jgi:hypothetical protein